MGAVGWEVLFLLILGLWGLGFMVWAIIGCGRAPQAGNTFQSCREARMNGPVF